MLPIAAYATDKYAEMEDIIKTLENAAKLAGEKGLVRLQSFLIRPKRQQLLRWQGAMARVFPAGVALSKRNEALVVFSL